MAGGRPFIYFINFGPIAFFAISEWKLKFLCLWKAF